MHRRHRIFIVAAAALLSSLGFWGYSRSRGRPHEVRAGGADVLRKHFFSYDWEAGTVQGRRLFSASRTAREVGAWFAVNAGRDNDEDEALRVARILLAADGDDPWSHFALAGALVWNRERAADALEASAKALHGDPQNFDFLWLRAETLRLRGQKGAAIALLNERTDVLDGSADLQVVKASAIYDESLERNVDAPTRNRLRAEALEVFRRARAAAPTSVGGYYTAAWFLTTSRRIPEAFALLQSASKLSMSPRVHKLFWRVTAENWELDEQTKREVLSKDLARFIAGRPEYASTQTLAGNQARQMHLETQRLEFETNLLHEGEGSAAAEEALVRSILDQTANSSVAGQDLASRRRALREFVQSPKHREPSLVDAAYRKLFDLADDDPAINPGELLEVVSAIRSHATSQPEIMCSRGALALARRRVYLDVADRLLRECLLSAQSGPAPSERERARRLAKMHDALGQVLLLREHKVDAEKEFLTALEADPQIADAAFHLGELNRERGDLEKAENFFVTTLAASTSDLAGRSTAAISGIYEQRHGGGKGLDPYMASVRAREGTSRSLSHQKAIDMAAGP